MCYVLQKQIIDIDFYNGYIIYSPVKTNEFIRSQFYGNNICNDPNTINFN